MFRFRVLQEDALGAFSMINGSTGVLCVVSANKKYCLLNC